MIAKLVSKKDNEIKNLIRYLKEKIKIESGIVEKLGMNLYPPNTGRADTQESLNRNVGKSRENRLFKGVLEGF